MDVTMGDDRLDSRTILERIDDLELEEDDANAEEIAMWKAMLEEAEDHAGDSAEDGIFFVLDAAWGDYAREYADDTGAFSGVRPDPGFLGARYVPVDLSDQWPFNHIDWASAGAELREDYASIDVVWDSRTYTYWYW